MTAFPILSRKPDQKTYKEQAENPAIITPQEGGYDITRPRHTRRPRRYFVFRYRHLTNAEKELLQQHWDAVRGGSEAFEWIRPTDGQSFLVRYHEMEKGIDFSYEVYEEHAGVVNHRWDTGDIMLKEV